MPVSSPCPHCVWGSRRDISQALATTAMYLGLEMSCLEPYPHVLLPIPPSLIISIGVGMWLVVLAVH